MTEYAVIYERGKDGSWHASAGFLPVFAVGDTRDEAEARIRSAIEGHLEFLRERGEPIPVFDCEVGMVSVELTRAA